MSRKSIGKKLFAITLAASVALTMAGCSRKPEETAMPETQSAAAAVTVPVAVAEETGEVKAQAAAAEVEAVPEIVKSAVIEMTMDAITGQVTDAGMSTVTITTDKYPEGITFLKEDVPVSFADGLTVGQEITVFYSGELQDGDASAVSVELIRDKREHDEDIQVAAITGRIAAIGMSAVTIETEDGRTASFEQDPKPVTTTDGLKETDKVTIIYSYQDEGSEGAIVPELIKWAGVE